MGARTTRKNNESPRPPDSTYPKPVRTPGRRPRARNRGASAPTNDVKEDWEDWNIYQVDTTNGALVITGYTIAPPSPVHGLTLPDEPRDAPTSEHTAATKPGPPRSNAEGCTGCYSYSYKVRPMLMCSLLVCFLYLIGCNI